MNKYKRSTHFFYIFLFILFTFLLILPLNYQTVLAADTNQADYENALKTVPKGLSWSDGAFSEANFEGNSAQIVQSKNPNSPNTSIIKMTNTTNQVGGIWSNFDKDNYFNVNHNQKVSMWLYFGYAKSITDPNRFFPGDGMAFVLHNDARGINAHSTGIRDGKLTPGDGETLGVWGTDWDPSETNSANIAKTAIQNSVAIEFDTFIDRVSSYDDIKGEGASFDLSYSGSKNYDPHIAFGYPAKPITYIPQYAQDSAGNRRNFFMMYHQNAYGGTPSEFLNLVDSKWHHLTVEWQKPDSGSTIGKLTYHYDDKDPVTSTPLSSEITRSLDINTNTFASADGKLYWGFTGSTGTYTENNLIAFESIPSYVDAQATSTIHNDTENTDISQNSHVNANDKITYNYNLSYIGWTREWSNIKARMDIPSNMTFSSGEITYANGQTETIPSSVFDTSTNKINYTLLQNLNKDNRTATISLHGRAAATANEQLTVPSAHAHFDGDNLITDTDSSSFIIDPRSITLESSSPYIIKVQKDESVDIPAQVKFLGSGSIDFSKLTVYQKINNEAAKPLTGLVNADGSFTLHIDKSLLTSDSTNVTFFVKDENGDLGETNTLTRTIQIGGTVAFGEVSSHVAFKDVNYGTKNKLIPRINDWHVNVVDSRSKGTSWVVQAAATPLVNKTTKKDLDGSLVYRQDPDSHTVDLSHNVNIAQYTKQNDLTETRDITLPWTDQSGILLSLNDNPSAGQYTGVINWTLLDSI
ncbi:hypothetical protein EGT49_11960 [Companilactobacillus suantsaicola]|uniref:Extracellular protein n=1 Tax=Companilactobacillus suantsaicola TaxID=2487723 RepID=A0A4Z0JEB8_9LACO|nr:hypothetical protein [Companilactobacillus suantsaicola]TGD21138.1 hypothetical protein EGT49_11960 [Companilactobacillus suantsaicola]